MGSWLGCSMFAAACLVTSPALATPTRSPQAAVTPAELGDRDVLARIHRHARITSAHQAWIDRAGEPISAKQDSGAREVVPVIAEDTDRVRIVETSDGARLALWIERYTLAKTVIKDVRLVDANHKTETDSGIWLAVGADVDASAAENGWSKVTIRDEMIRASGYARQDVIGDIWTGPEPTEPAHGKRLGVPANTLVRAWPEDNADPIAETPYIMGVDVVGPQVGNLQQIELRRPGIRVLGWLSVLVLGSVPYGGSFSSAAGNHVELGAATASIAAGACLYDRESGDIIGVNLETTTRSVDWQGGWAQIYVSTRWGIAAVFAHATAKAGDPVHARWKSCTSTPARAR